MTGPRTGPAPEDGRLAAFKRRVPEPVKARLREQLRGDTAFGRFVERTRAGVQAFRDDGAAAPPVLPSGVYLAPFPLPAVHRVLVIFLGGTNEQLRRLVRELALEQTMTMSFVPLLLTDCHDLTPVEAVGWACEYVMPRSDWQGLRLEAAWESMVKDRVTALRGTWQLDAVVAVPPGMAETMGPLLQAAVGSTTRPSAPAIR